MKCKCGSTDFLDRGMVRTLLAFDVYYIDGVRHSHNPNKVRRVYECKVCKEWTEEIIQQTCPNCDWKGFYGSRVIDK